MPVTRLILHPVSDAYGLLRKASYAGDEAGAEDADSGELLAETLDLRYAFYDLDGKTSRAIGVDELVMAVRPARTRATVAANYAYRRSRTHSLSNGLNLSNDTRSCFPFRS